MLTIIQVTTPLNARLTQASTQLGEVRETEQSEYNSGCRGETTKALNSKLASSPDNKHS